MPDDTPPSYTKYETITPRRPRRIRPYPLRPRPMVQRLGRGVLRRTMLRLPRPRRHARPWKYRTRLDYTAALEERAAQNVRGSLQERIFYQVLVNYGLIPDIDFSFQTSMLGGRMELGGLVADFIFPVVGVIVQVQSMWHNLSLEFKVRDQDQAAVLQSMGYVVFEIWPNTIEDQAALDLWIERNIMHLWGTSANALGSSHGRDIPFLLGITADLQYDFTELLRLLKEILEALR